MSKPSEFLIGDIVTLQSHPLAFQENGLIDASINQIPPLMCIKEIHFEKKKNTYSAENEGRQIADKTKYLCVYFNQYRMIFEEKMIYKSMLIGLGNLKFHRKDEKTEEDGKTLIEETDSYNKVEINDDDNRLIKKSNISYEYGKRVFFKTYKLEKRKKFASAGLVERTNRKSAVVHTSPAFVLSGIKINDQKSIYNEKDGKPIKTTSETLFKVLWYNSYQEKMSEVYLPKELFTDDERIVSSPAKHKEYIKDKAVINIYACKANK